MNLNKDKKSAAKETWMKHRYFSSQIIQEIMEVAPEGALEEMANETGLFSFDVLRFLTRKYFNPSDTRFLFKYVQMWEKDILPGAHLYKVLNSLKEEQGYVNYIN